MAKLVAKAKEDKPVIGMIFMLIAYLCFSFIDTSAKWLALAGLTAFQISFMRYFGHFVISLGLISKGGISAERFTTDHLGLVVLRGALLAVSTLLNFIALRYIPLTLTSTILFSSPIIICALSGPLLGEKVGLWRWSAIFIGFIGLVVAIRPFGESFHWAMLLSLFNAFAFAFYSILTRKLAGIVASDTLQFYSGMIGTFALAPLAIYSWQNPENIRDWIILCMTGFFGWAGHELLTRAHGYATATTLTPFGYSFIVYLTIWSYFLFDNIPDRWTVIGALIIVVAGLIIWMREKSHKKTPVELAG